MAIEDLTLSQLEERLDWLENLMASRSDPRDLAVYNQMCQQIIDRLVELDTEVTDGS